MTLEQLFLARNFLLFRRRVHSSVLLVALLGSASCCEPSFLLLLQVKPVLSYVVLSLNLLVYCYGILIAVTQGGEASNDYFLSLAKVNENVMNGEYYRCAQILQAHCVIIPYQNNVSWR